MKQRKPTRKEKAQLQKPAAEALEQEKKLSESRKKLSLYLSLLVAALGFLLYSNTLNHAYVLDDYSVIKENRVTRQGWDAFPEVFTKSYRYGYYFINDELYRPVPKAMFAIEWALFPDNPSPSHWVNVLLYALTGFILFKVLVRYLKNNFSAAFIISVLFIAHPIHTEVVANIKSRDEILSLLFILFSLLFIHKYIVTKNFKLLLAAMTFYLLSLLSKESGITFIAVFPVLIYFFTHAGKGMLWRITAMMAVPAFIFLLIRNGILAHNLKENFSVADNLLMAIHDPAGRFATAVYILGIYLKQLVYPHPLVFDKSFNEIEAVGITDFRFILSALIYVSLVIVSLIRFKKREPMVFGAIYFLLTISIFSNIIVIIGTSYGERLMYLPSLGFCISFGFLIQNLFQRGKAGYIENMPSFFKSFAKPIIVCFAIALAYSAKTFSRNSDWKDSWTLFTHDVQLAPNSTRTHYYLGNYMIKPENIGVNPDDSVRMNRVLDSAIVEMKKALEIYPKFCDVYKQLGVAYGKKKETRESFDSYLKAIECNPTDPPAHSNIGTIYFNQGNYPEALKAFQKAVSLDPNYTEALVNLGSAYGMMKDYPNALKYLHQCVKTDPGYTQAYYFLSITYQFMGDQQNAEIYMSKFKSLGGQK